MSNENRRDHESISRHVVEGVKLNGMDDTGQNTGSVGSGGRLGLSPDSCGSHLLTSKIGRAD